MSDKVHGNKGRKMPERTEEHRRKLSEAWKNRVPISEETKRKISKALKGRKKSRS